ncbi:DUF1801 domain-containing protein [Flavobacterium branchiarum]|uniref:DUF1801 domain-containing protein n=1 Tax=Flavobacterium branchiarum TaxID=1114870 RepID=A0ABV5FPT6_9FLAO|nr:DUF1801 domain-containing protein [Flavobacterium branchiarum]MDN3675624.1 DUF1801 domain-containing protein [Flavobacterium branchiarum]
MSLELDNFYLKQEEPNKGCLLALRGIILSQDSEITHTLKYGMPFFCYRGKMFCYLWIHKTNNKPYIGIVEGKHFDNPELLSEKRSRMKIMFLEPHQDIPIDTIRAIIEKAIGLYKSGVIKIKNKN